MFLILIHTKSCTINTENKNSAIPIFISATNTNIGKTYTILYFIKKLSSMGYKVGVYKPIETGIDINSKTSDAYLSLSIAKQYNKQLANFTTSDVLSYHFSYPAAPYIAKEQTKISKNKLLQDFKTLQSTCDILLIEGAGGLMVPIEKDFFMIDLISLFRAKTILVSSSALGCINDLLLSKQALENKKIDFKWLVNMQSNRDSFYKQTYPYYKDSFKKVNILKEDDEDIFKFLISQNA